MLCLWLRVVATFVVFLSTCLKINVYICVLVHFLVIEVCCFSFSTMEIVSKNNISGSWNIGKERSGQKLHFIYLGWYITYSKIDQNYQVCLFFRDDRLGTLQVWYPPPPLNSLRSSKFVAFLDNDQIIQQLQHGGYTSFLVTWSFAKPMDWILLMSV